MDSSTIDRRRRLSAALWHLADLTAVSDRTSFRSRAFRDGAWSVEAIDDPSDVTREELLAIDGIGPGIAGLVVEFGETGRIDRLDRLSAELPAESARLIGLPRMTLGRLRSLKQSLGVDTRAELIDAIHNEGVETLQGIGPATADRWLEILSLAPSPSSLPAHAAALLAARLRHHLAAHAPAAGEVVVSGAVRRLEEWADAIDLVVVSADVPSTKRWVGGLAVAAATRQEDETTAVELHDGTCVHVTVSDPRRVGTAVFVTTGPREHVRALAPAEPHPTETAVYGAVGLPWIPPPARRSEPIDVAGIIAPDMIRGDLHVHTESSPDGRMSLEEVVEAAITRGYEYVAITDHTEGLGFGGLDADGLRAQRQAIDTVRARFPDIAVYHGAEINIDRSGSPDIDDDTLAWLDFVVAGCHSHFDLPQAEQTTRLVAAVSHPSIHVLAHPTGRRIGIRSGFQLDLDAVCEAAAAHDTALEVNGHRDRMDLSSEAAERAVAAGVRLAANGDAHRAAELDNVSVAVGVMQRALVMPTSVVNTLARADFDLWIRSK